MRTATEIWKDIHENSRRGYLLNAELYETHGDARAVAWYRAMAEESPDRDRLYAELQAANMLKSGDLTCLASEPAPRRAAIEAEMERMRAQETSHA